MNYRAGDRSGILVHFRLIFVDELNKTFMSFNPRFYRKRYRNARGVNCSGSRIDDYSEWECGTKNATSVACNCLVTAHSKDIKLTTDLLYSRIGMTIEMHLDFKMHLYLCPQEDITRQNLTNTDTNTNIPFSDYKDKMKCLQLRFDSWFNAFMHANQARTTKNRMETTDLLDEDIQEFQETNVENFDIREFFTDSASM